MHSRLVWQFKDADWDGLRHALSLVQWSKLLDADANSAAQRLTLTILDLAAFFIHQRTLRERKSTHPWISDEVVQKVWSRRYGKKDRLRAQIEKKSAGGNAAHIL